jgi:hypothetical protein
MRQIPCPPSRLVYNEFNHERMKGKKERKEGRRRKKRKRKKRRGE